MPQKKYLVTGGAGFVGSNIAWELVRQGNAVTIVDDFSSGHFKNLLGFKGDIITANLAETLPPADYYDAIFHEAAIPIPMFTTKN